jgi:hypothetical protein
MQLVAKRERERERKQCNKGRKLNDVAPARTFGELFRVYVNADDPRCPT